MFGINSFKNCFRVDRIPAVSKYAVILFGNVGQIRPGAAYRPDVVFIGDIKMLKRVI